MIDIIFKILISILLGVLIGLERESSGKAVGTRTVSLIILGSALFSYMSINLPGCDSARIIAQIVCGVGFLGAGVLVKNGNKISGLTTAATIWASASIGCLVGISWYKEAIIATISVCIINLLFSYLKFKL